MQVKRILWFKPNDGVDFDASSSSVPWEHLCRLDGGHKEELGEEADATAVVAHAKKNYQRFIEEMQTAS